VKRKKIGEVHRGNGKKKKEKRKKLGELGRRKKKVIK